MENGSLPGTPSSRRTIRVDSCGRSRPSATGSRRTARPVPGDWRLQGGVRPLSAYVALICPWASRTLIARKLKGLEELVTVTIVNPLLSAQGWAFGGYPKAEMDPLHGSLHLHQFYTHADDDFTRRASNPVLWDEKIDTMVSNESADIVRMFDTAFADLVPGRPDLYPADLRADIDALNAEIYDPLNNGVYKAGFTSTQAAYDEAVAGVFSMLDRLEERLTGEYLFGDRFTEADIRLFCDPDPLRRGLSRSLQDQPKTHRRLCASRVLHGTRAAPAGRAGGRSTSITSRRATIRSRRSIRAGLWPSGQIMRRPFLKQCQEPGPHQADRLPTQRRIQRRCDAALASEFALAADMRFSDAPQAVDMGLGRQWFSIKGIPQSKLTRSRPSSPPGPQSCRLTIRSHAWDASDRISPGAFMRLHTPAWHMSECSQRYAGHSGRTPSYQSSLRYLSAFTDVGLSRKRGTSARRTWALRIAGRRPAAD
jgi:glutathione S-transferase